jgi:TolB-like protein/DNA-binding winged helix-turn-helix (wHTH) protein
MSAAPVQSIEIELVMATAPMHQEPRQSAELVQATGVASNRDDNSRNPDWGPSCLAAGSKMNSGDRPHAVLNENGRVGFDRFVLDLERGSLTDGRGTDIELRPKTFAVLCHLVANAGRLVSKDELLSAIWPDVAVTDDTLVQSVGELRRALGNAGPQLIRTIPRRGYRFEGIVSGATTGPPEPSQSATPPEVASAVARSAPGDDGAGGLIRRFASSSTRTYAGVALLALLVTLGVWTWPQFKGASLTEASSIDRARTGIAVLPFSPRGGDPGRAYFADGVTQDIISALGRFSALTVMSWNAVLPFRDGTAGTGTISDRLGVSYQVEGSVTLVGERVRVSSQLVSRGGQVLWSATFDEAEKDLFALQDRIATQIAGALAVRLTEAEQRRAFAKPTSNLQAYDQVLRARPALQRPSRAGLAEARVLLRRAIELDPSYAAAHAALAESFYIALSWGWAEAPQAVLTRAEQLAGTALQLDDANVRARVLLGRIYLVQDRHEQARAQMDRALAVNPSDAHALAGRGNILMWLGEIRDAVASLELAARIDPELNAIDRFALSLAYYLDHRYGAAIEQARQNLRNSEDAVFSHVVIAAAAGQLGRPEDAANALRETQRRDPTLDLREFATKLRNPDHLEHVRDGLRKAGN